MSKNETITLTFGDCGENHKGMEIIGSLAKNGISIDALEKIAQLFPPEKTELVELTQFEENDAKILIVRDGVNILLDGKYTANDLLKEQRSFIWDEKAYMYGRVVNKKARHNLCFSKVGQEPDYETGKGRIVAFDDAPISKKLKKRIEKLINPFLAEKTKLIIEGNRYYDVRKCGIGYHGDTERRIVIGVRLGATMPICFQWYFQNQRVGKKMTLNLNHGDFYIMSEKAVGFDWKRSSIFTLRHSAGCDKYTA